ncbi:hypothetical protein IT575_10110 [bacterium]|nr:hypothetical protein [bacterium]
MREVSSKGAQRALKALERLIAKIRHVEGVSDFNLLHQAYQFSPQGIGYRNFLQQKLAGSDIALRLMDGLDAFPDIVESMPPLLRPLERLFMPRTLEQTACYLARHLAWYLDPKRDKPRYGLSRLWPLLDLLIGIALITFSLMRFPDYLWLMLLGLGSFLSMFIRLHFVGQGGLLLGADPSSEDFHINALELYRYLHAAWSDPPEGAAAVTALPAADLASSPVAESLAREQH